jgi:predicted PurR-regulated permease PerM
MSVGSLRRDLRQPLIVLSTTVLVIGILGFMYLARAVVIPLALAVFLTFILSPGVTLLRRHGLGHVPAVFIVVLTAIAVVLLVAGLISWQVTALAQELPDHRHKIRAKLESVRLWIGGEATGRFATLLHDVEEAINPKPATAPIVVPVEVVSRPPGWISNFESAVGPVVEALASTIFTIVLVAFLLYSKEDMRNRMLRLIGPRRLTATTKAVDDAGTRISRYLRTQLIINAAFGLVLTGALLLLNVRYAVLWGFVAAVMRYIPYIGAWVGLVPPLVASWAMTGTDDWWQPLSVLGVYAALELVTANIAEPRLLGHSLGLSEVAQLVSAGFWAFMWGPIGLILSGPITACLLVAGKNVKQLRSLEVLLGVDEPLTPPMAFFQRLTARDRDEAWRIASEYASANSPEAVPDGLVFPAMALVQNAVENDELSRDDGEWIVATVCDITDDLKQPKPSEEAVAQPAIAEPVRLLGVPAGSVGDRLALQLLAERLPAERWEIKLLNNGVLASEVLAALRDQQPAVVVVATLASESLTQTRYLCKRLRAADPDVKIFVGHWGNGPLSPSLRTQLIDVGVDNVVAELSGLQKLLESWSTPFAVNAATDESPNREKVGTASAL